MESKRHRTATRRVALRDLRKAAGLTVAQAARAAGYIDRTSYAYVETQGRQPKWPKAEAMAQAFGVSIGALFDALHVTHRLWRKRGAA